MPYIGKAAVSGIRKRFTFLASAGATSISGADANGQTLTFDDGTLVDVFLNGVKLKTGEDYNTSTANTIAGLTALNLNDEVEILAYDTFSSADAVSKRDGGTFDNAISVTGNITSTGNLIINDGGNIGSTSDTDAISISSTGDVTLTQDLKIKDGGTIGSASDADAISIASTGDVTLTQNLKVKDGGTIGSASATDAMTVASTGIVTFKDDIVLKDAATIGVASSTSAISIASTGIVTFVDDIVVKDGGTIGVASDTDAIGITSTGQVDIDSQLALGNTNFTSILSANGESTGTGVGMTLRAGTDNSGVGGNAIVFGLYVGRAANSTYTFLACGAGTTNADSTLSDPTHKLLGNGATNADGAYSSTGADYAEMFEWEDGNSSNEDRVGYTVVLSGNKIRKSTSDDSASSIIGVVSSRPVILGDNDIDSWKGRWLTDDFGRRVMESHTLTEWTDSEGNKVNYETDNIPSDVTPPSDAVVRTKDDDGQTLQRKKVNPSFDPSKTYERREDRKEWDAIGLMGKLRVRKGQDVGDRWIKMRDVSDSVEEYLVR